MVEGDGEVAGVDTQDQAKTQVPSRLQYGSMTRPLQKGRNLTPPSNAKASQPPNLGDGKVCGEDFGSDKDGEFESGEGGPESEVPEREARPGSTSPETPDAPGRSAPRGPQSPNSTPGREGGGNTSSPVPKGAGGVLAVRGNEETATGSQSLLTFPYFYQRRQCEE